MKIDIVPFRDDLAADFDRLNRGWLEGYGLLEESDLPYLTDPRGQILDRGGAVLFATRDDSVIGTVAILPLSTSTFELAKLAVATDARGGGVGRRLVVAAIDFAVSRGARRIVLSSSSRLVAALRLYESLGFRCSEPDPASVAYMTADVHMELEIETVERRNG